MADLKIEENQRVNIGEQEVKARHSGSGLSDMVVGTPEVPDISEEEFRAILTGENLQDIDANRTEGVEEVEILDVPDHIEQIQDQIVEPDLTKPHPHHDDMPTLDSELHRAGNFDFGDYEAYGQWRRVTEESRLQAFEQGLLELNEVEELYEAKQTVEETREKDELQSDDDWTLEAGSPPNQPPTPPINYRWNSEFEDEEPSERIPAFESIEAAQQRVQEDPDFARQVIESSKWLLTTLLQRQNPLEFREWFRSKGEALGIEAEWGREALSEWVEEHPDFGEKLTEAFIPEFDSIKRKLEIISEARSRLTNNPQLLRKIFETYMAKLEMEFKQVPPSAPFRQLKRETAKEYKLVQGIIGAKGNRG